MRSSCATLCHSAFSTTSRALFVALLTVGCGGETATAGGSFVADGTGGNTTNLGTSNVGGSGGAAGSPGTGGSAGMGGATQVTDCNAWGTYPDCGTCQMTLQEYCTTPSLCQLSQASICTQLWFGSNWQRGCGYVRVDYWGDVSDRATKIWDEASGTLVYYWFNGRMSSGCVPETHAGTEPVCNAWTNACADAGR